MPADIFHLILDHLEPAPIITLSLTCKTLFALLFPTAKHALVPPSDLKTAIIARPSSPVYNPVKAELCELLERELADRYYFCSDCCRLQFHRHAPPALSSLPSRTLKRSGLTVGLDHVRLMLNQHSFGPRSGIPLENFELITCRQPHRRGSRNGPLRASTGPLPGLDSDIAQCLPPWRVVGHFGSPGVRPVPTYPVQKRRASVPPA